MRLVLPTRPLKTMTGLAAVSLAGPAPRRGPIWHCSRWGLPCRYCCQQRGGLLPHRFILTQLHQNRSSGLIGAVCFLWRFPSDCPARALPGTVVMWSPDFPPVQVPPPRRPSGSPRRERHRRFACSGPERAVPKRSKILRRQITTRMRAIPQANSSQQGFVIYTGSEASTPGQGPKQIG